MVKDVEIPLVAQPRGQLHSGGHMLQSRLTQDIREKAAHVTQREVKMLGPPEVLVDVPKKDMRYRLQA